MCHPYRGSWHYACLVGLRLDEGGILSMKKRFLSVMMSICMLLSLLMISVFADVGEITPSEVISITEDEEGVEAEETSGDEIVTEETNDSISETDTDISGEATENELFDEISIIPTPDVVGGSLGETEPLAAIALASMADTTPPELKGLEFDQGTVEAGGTITITADVSDDISGVSIIFLNFKNQSSGKRVSAQLSDYDRTGIYKKTVEISQYEAAGEFKLSSFEVQDYAGNYVYRDEQMGDIIPNYFFTVTNDGTVDTTPPELKGLEFDQGTVEAGGTITITADVSDDISGVSIIFLNFKNQSSGKRVSAQLSDYDRTGIYKKTVEISQYEAAGEFKLSSFEVQDYAGNYVYRDEQMGDIIPNYFFVVTNKNIIPDTSPPTLSSGSANRTSNTSATITFTTNEKGTAYYKVVEKGALAPEITDASTIHGFTSLGSINAGTVPAKHVSLTAGAKDIYVYVVDASGNYNEGLKIEAAAYSSGSGGSTGGGSGGGGGSAAPSTPVVKTPEVAPQPEAPVAPTDNTENSQPKTTTVIKPGSKIATITNDDGTSRQTTMDVAPMIQDGRTMMPARFVADVLGVGVNYDNQTKTATFKYDEATVTLTLGQKTMIVNGQTVALQTAPMLVDGRILLPLRDIQEAFKGLGLKATIDWNAETKEVTIAKQ